MKKEINSLAVPKKVNWWRAATKQEIDLSLLWKKEDWWTVWLGFLLIFASITGLIARPTLPLRWGPGIEGVETIGGSITPDILLGILVVGVVSLALFSLAILFIERKKVKKFIIAFPLFFFLPFWQN